MIVFLKELKLRFFEDKVFDLSAQLAYYFFVSLFPFSFLIFTILGFLPISSAAVLEIIRPFAPVQAFHLLEYNLISVLDQNRSDIFSISIVITIWLSSIGILAIIRVSNQAYHVIENRPFIRELFLGILLTLGLVLAIVTSLLLPVFGNSIGIFLANRLGYDHPAFHLWNTTRWTLSFVILMVMFVSLYLIAPNIRLKLKNVLPGAFFSTIGWQLISIGFSYYVTLFDYRQIYGNLGALLTLMIWFYLSAMILILGGQINAALLTIHKRKAEQR
ncbi:MULTISPECIES: YihY/virulence factor BrkB family protein [Fictibacillus]|uniref:YihY/virulence factor BrkB family protein n=1 Tax=Fictibacillus terranigra TaxID=3058424 RepID=A0ABT8ECK5_9BACL|nr:YihY/virulence factor BrkB family protein [Fictibacillus sp. CENA-BCM004]MDN4075656.1 YihY/virulence factor BrkB family protein [Fictibacillus sp. CENA-BCM004]